MSNTSDKSLAEEEARTRALLAALYGDDRADAEVEGGEREAGEGDVSIGPRDTDLPAESARETGSEKELIDVDELESLRSLRSILREMPEEEPSAAVSNKLLAMAAQHAPKASKASGAVEGAEATGLWAWLRGQWQSLGHNPGMLAAASVCVMVAVAGSLYVRGDLDPSDPASSTEEKERAPEIIATGVSAETSFPEPAAEGALEMPAEPADERAAADSAFDDGAAQQGPTRNAPKSTAPAGVVSGKADSSYGSGRSKGAKGTSVRTGDRKQLQKKRANSSSFSTESTPTAKPKAPKPSLDLDGAMGGGPQPPPKEEADEVQGVQEQEKVANDKDSEPAVSAAVRKAFENAKASARKGDCQAVIKAAARIRKADASFYDRTFLGDAAIRACMQKRSKSLD